MKRLSALSRPPFWLYLLAGLLPFERIPAAPVFGFHLRPSLVAALVLVLIVFARSPRLLVPKGAVHRLLYVFLAVCALSSLLSAQPSHVWRITAYTMLAALLAIAVAATVRMISLRTLCLVLLGSSLLVSLFAFYQFVGDLAGLSDHLTGLKPMYSSQVFGFPRVQAASLEPLYFANYLLLPLAILTALGLVVGVSFVALTTIDTALLLTLSRGGVGVAALVIIFFVGLGLYRRRLKDVAKIGLAVVASLSLTYGALTYVVPTLHRQPAGTVRRSAVSVYSNQVTNLEVGNNKVDRAQTRNLAVKAFTSHPILGVGPGNFGYYAQAHSSYSRDQIVNNEPLELLAETGLVGFVAFVAFVLALAAQAVRSLRRDARTIHRAVTIGTLVYLTATAIQYWSFSTLYIIQVWFAIGLVIGLTNQPGEPVKAVVS